MHRTYVIAESIVTNPEQQFVPAIQRSHNKYGGILLARTDTPETLRSETVYTRVIIFEFQDKAQVYKWYQSPEAQRAFDLSKSCAGDIMIRIVDGINIQLADTKL